MSLSSGTKTALAEAASWGIAGIILVSTVVYFEDLKFLFSPGQLQASTPVKTQSPNVSAPPQRHVASVRRSDTAPAPVRSAGYVVQLKAGRHGHYKTPARINGREIQVLVDTGASYVALSAQDAERAGVYVSPADFKYKSQTANGTTRIAIVTIDRISIGDIEVRNVRASVHERGKLNITLLGMSFLSKLRRAEMRNGRLILEN